MSRADRIALLFSLLAVIAAYLVADRVFERLPHLEDEMAYAWQAEVFAKGQVTIPSPPEPKSMMVPFVVDYHGQRFGKYLPGWPMLLAFGAALGVRAWVNPLLAGLGVWLTYRLGRKLFSPRIGLLAAFLTLTSPFFLLNSGSLLSHSWSLALSLSFVLAWLDTFPRKDAATIESDFVGKSPSGWLTVAVAGLSLGVLALTRPLTAVGVALPFFVHGLILLARGGRAVRLRLLTISLLAAAVAALIFAWQFAVTGDPLLNPYLLWWKYDKIGFGPGYGRQAGGHSLYWAWVDLKSSLATGWKDFFGWGTVSWLFLPFGLWAMRRERAAWLAAAVFPSLLLVYMTYWIGSHLFGPRYYYEGFYSLTLTTAAGIFWLAEEVVRAGRWRRVYQTGLGLLLVFLIGYNLAVYLPGRLGGMYGLYGIRREHMQPFLTEAAQSLTPALVIVHIQDTWTDYGTLLSLEDPWLTTPFIFALSRGRMTDTALQGDYPDRRVVHYYPDESYKFYDSPR